MLLGATAVLWPYAFHRINWYGLTMWDGIVAIGGGALQSGIPAWFYLMVLAPVVSLIGGLLLLFPFRWVPRTGRAFALVSLLQFPFGTLAGIIALLFLGNTTTEKSGEQVAAPNSTLR